MAHYLSATVGHSPTGVGCSRRTPMASASRRYGELQTVCGECQAAVGPFAKAQSINWYGGFAGN